MNKGIKQGMAILGISAYYHDSAAAIVKNGEVIAAVQEERFSRIKHDAAFPLRSCEYCLKAAQISIDELDAVVFYDKPFLKFERLIESYYRFAPRGLPSFLKAIPVWLREKLFLKRIIRKKLAEIEAFDPQKLQLLFTEHHLSHAASAFFASPFEAAAILTIDGVGEWATASLGIGKGKEITIIKELHFPHSPGLLYSAFTYFLGFKVNGGEYKLMGLAPYGDAHSHRVKRFISLIYEKLIDLKPDGSLWLNQQYFDYVTGLRMIKAGKWEMLFGFARRTPETAIEQVHCDLAFAIQKVLENIVLGMVKEIKRITGLDNLCMAGGVALNCVANGKIVQKAIFKKLFIQPAAGDAGGALGAALAAYHIYGDQARKISTGSDKMKGTYLGPDFSKTVLRNWLDRQKLSYIYFEHFDKLCRAVSTALADGKIVGWFQGRMEYGPRALGNRSILGDPRNPKMQSIINQKIKNREHFRPFAPAVLAGEASDYFELEDNSSPYMLLVTKINEEQRIMQKTTPSDLSLKDRLAIRRSALPAITHVDYSARIQTVHEASNPKFFQLLRAFKEKTGYGVLINTSFNIRNEPIVCSPEDAYHCFIKTGMDLLVMDQFVLKKHKSGWNF